MSLDLLPLLTLSPSSFPSSVLLWCDTSQNDGGGGSGREGNQGNIPLLLEPQKFAEESSRLALETTMTPSSSSLTLTRRYVDRKLVIPPPPPFLLRRIKLEQWLNSEQEPCVKIDGHHNLDDEQYATAKPQTTNHQPPSPHQQNSIEKSVGYFFITSLLIHQQRPWFTLLGSR